MMDIRRLFLLLSVCMSCCHALEPISTSVAVVTAIGAGGFFAAYDLIKCNFYECCETPWINSNMTGLSTTLNSKLYGQHLVINTVVNSLKGHIKNKNPSKALVLSFHGWTGGGKNYVSRIISEHLYAQGMSSKYVHLFVSTVHFPHQSKLETYKDQLREWIKGNVSVCERSMFIFDEMDKMPVGLIAAIKPYLDYHPEINGVNYRKSIFILLSNTAGTDITKRTIKQWEEGRPREQIEHVDMENLITLGAFNEEGGLWHSPLIENHLISAFIPFLPLERRHVKMCARDDLVAKGYRVSEELLSKVADQLVYFPPDNQLFSKSGCKRVSQKVDVVIEDLLLDDPNIDIKLNTDDANKIL